MRTNKLTLLGLFTAVSLMIFIVESFIPPLVPIPGIKLGLANIVTLIVIQCSSYKDALLVLLARILLSTFFFGTAMSLLYSICGGFLALLIMALSNKLLQKHMLFLSGMLGALFHNIGQITVAYFITATSGVLVYLPFLCISGIITGFFTGMCAHFISKRLLKLKAEKQFFAK